MALARFPLHCWMPGAVAAAVVAAVPASVLAGATAVSLPRAGVVCDAATRTCYSAEGASLRETRYEYGYRAEQELVRRLSGRPPAREFTLSGGELCDLRQRTCWDDGSKRRNVSNRLTRQLWGGADGRERTCRLSQRGRSLFDGRCRLTRRADFNGTAYQVETSDGRRYNFFVNREGRLVLRDATGLWPVTTSTWGNRVEFRWADLQLETFSRQGDAAGGTGYGGGYGSENGPGMGMNGYGDGFGQGYRNAPTPTPSPIPVSPGQALDTILNGLFK